MLSEANQLLDEELLLYNETFTDVTIDRLYYDEFTQATFTGFVAPVQFLGEKVQSVPVRGSVIYTGYAFDKEKAMALLSKELHTHVGTGRRLLPESIDIERLVYHVVDYSDDISWIKITADLTGKEISILDPLSPQGAKFAKKLRERVQGLGKDEALRRTENLPEVDAVEISLWPPWSASLPSIPTQIVITPIEE